MHRTSGKATHPQKSSKTGPIQVWTVLLISMHHPAFRSKDRENKETSEQKHSKRRGIWRKGLPPLGLSLIIFKILNLCACMMMVMVMENSSKESINRVLIGRKKIRINLDPTGLNRIGILMTVTTHLSPRIGAHPHLCHSDDCPRP